MRKLARRPRRSIAVLVFWICLNIAAIAPDGHNVLDDNSGCTQS